jgi:hypothetical protein
MSFEVGVEEVIEYLQKFKLKGGLVQKNGLVKEKETVNAAYLQSHGGSVGIQKVRN